MNAFLIIACIYIALVLTVIGMVMTIIEMVDYKEDNPKDEIFQTKFEFILAITPLVGFFFRAYVWFKRSRFVEKYKSLGNEKKTIG